MLFTKEYPLLQEPSSPEPAKTQSSAMSPSGVLVLPCGTAIQMKRELEEEEYLRKKRKSSLSSEINSKTSISPASPPSSSKVFIFLSLKVFLFRHG